MPLSEDNLHPLLGRRLSAPIPDRIYESSIRASQPALLSEHKVHGAVVMPGAAHVELALAAAAIDGKSWIVEELSLLAPLVLSNQWQTIQTIVTPERPGLASFRIVSVAEQQGSNGAGFVTHASGQLRSARSAPSAENAVDLGALRRRFSGFSWMELCWQQGNELLAEIPAADERDGLGDYRSHPRLLDTLFQALGGTLNGKIEARSAFVPLTIARVRVLQAPAGRTWALATLRS